MDLEDAAAMRDIRRLLVVARKADLQYERLPAQVKAAIEREADDYEDALSLLQPVFAAMPPTFRQRFERSLLRVFTLLAVPAEGTALHLVEPAS